MFCDYPLRNVVKVTAMYGYDDEIRIAYDIGSTSSVYTYKIENYETVLDTMTTPNYYYF